MGEWNEKKNSQKRADLSELLQQGIGTGISVKFM